MGWFPASLRPPKGPSQVDAPVLLNPAHLDFPTGRGCYLFPSGLLLALNLNTSLSVCVYSLRPSGLLSQLSHGLMPMMLAVARFLILLHYVQRFLNRLWAAVESMQASVNILRTIE